MSGKQSFRFFFFLILGFINLMILPCYSFQKKAIDSTLYFSEKVNNPKHKDDLIVAFNYFTNLKDQNLKASNYTHAIYNLRQIAIIQNKLGFFYDSEGTAIEALKLVDNLPEDSTTTESRIGIYNQLGKLYRQLLENEKAITYYQKALELVTKQQHQMTLKNNIGYALIKSGKLNQALIEFEDLHNSLADVQDPKEKARILNNYGVVQGKLNHPDALKYLLQGLAMREALQISSEVIGSYMDISKYYSETGDTIKAETYARKAFALAKETDNSNIISETLDLVIGFKNDSEVQLYKQIRNSIETANLLTEGKYASKKYDLTQQEKMATANLIQAEKEKNLKLIYGYTAILLGVFAFIWFLIIRHRHKKQKQLEVYNTELRISKKVHDEVANDVYHLMNKLQQEQINKDSVLDDLEAVYEKTRDISREYHDIDVVNNYQELLKDLISNYQSCETNILIKGISKINWEGVSETKKVAMYRVIQELLTNMKKHSSATIVVFDFNKQGRKLQVQYTDNGIGSNLKKQNGLQNAENRINTINGSITFKSQINEGFSALITI
ncbi:Tetratricopeptide repeat-containing protein [Bizionia echini]|uniref:histidine kinase n=1 Tax=Bizionia echini TaxID=649333 RepID=A0A1I5AFX5_9FLAO|nr:tetratricopeptide repeat protein [Bizionia echini]SFN61089.1 Tetratricopeptide repeat-containing protein [Bizionia echini]